MTKKKYRVTLRSSTLGVAIEAEYFRIENRILKFYAAGIDGREEIACFRKWKYVQELENK